MLAEGQNRRFERRSRTKASFIVNAPKTRRTGFSEAYRGICEVCPADPSILLALLRFYSLVSLLHFAVAFEVSDVVAAAGHLHGVHD